jgi:hypothetical protein
MCAALIRYVTAVAQVRAAGWTRRASSSATRRAHCKRSGLNCYGYLFHHQPARVCRTATVEAMKRDMRDCDMIDQFGEVVIYVAADVDPRQMDLIGENT